MPEQRRGGGSRTQTRERPQAAPTSTASVADQLNAAPTKTTALARIQASVPASKMANYAAHGYDAIRLAMVWDQVARDLTLSEFLYFMERATVTGLDPLRGQMHAIKRRDSSSPTGFKVTHQVSIDGFRAMADSSGAYAGSDPPVFSEPCEFHGKQADEICRVTVYKIVQGVRVPFVGECRLSEYYPGDKQGALWIKYPHNQLAKCTEAQALRKAFPVQLGGLIADGEPGNADMLAQFADTAMAHTAGKDIGPQYVEYTDRATGEVTKVRGGDEYQRLYGDDSDEPLEQPRDDANPDEKQEPIDAEGRVVQHDNGETVNTVNTASGEILDPGEPMRVISETLAPKQRQSFLPKDVDQDDDTPPWEEPPARMPQSAAIPPKELPGADGGIVEKVAERAAQGLCTDPECVAANTPNKAAEGTNPPRCLNHVGD